MLHELVSSSVLVLLVLLSVAKLGHKSLVIPSTLKLRKLATAHAEAEVTQGSLSIINRPFAAAGRDGKQE